MIGVRVPNVTPKLATPSARRRHGLAIKLCVPSREIWKDFTNVGGHLDFKKQKYEQFVPGNLKRNSNRCWWSSDLLQD